MWRASIPSTCGTAIPPNRVRSSAFAGPICRQSRGTTRASCWALIRIGNEEYARRNGSFGLTTMRNRHADVDGIRIRFRFRGKSGRQHTVELQDRRLARTLHGCLETPGQNLFQYLDDSGQAHLLGSADVNDYLRKISGRDFTAKDFRTWAGTVLAARALQECET